MNSIPASQTSSVTIARDADTVYGFVSNPENLPRWAPAFCKSVRRDGENWIVDTPDGSMKLRFVEKNPFRVMDHYLSPSPGVEFCVPMRVLANTQGGSEILLTLLRHPDMSEEQFRRDNEMVARDLNVLKKVLES